MKRSLLLISCIIALIIIARQLALNANDLPGSNLPFTAVQINPISAGNANSIVITTDGDLMIFGANFSSQELGQTFYLYPTLQMEGTSLVSTSVGEIIWARYSSHSMAVTSDGALWVWGVDIREANALAHSARSRGWGRPYRPFSNLYAPINIMNNVIFASTGGGHALAITSDGTLWGWGNSSYSQLGDAPRNNSGRPVKIIDDIALISAGARHTMMVTSDGALWTCGSNRKGQLGVGIQARPLYLGPQYIMDDVVAISAGNEHSTAITANGELWAWGCNRHGQLGDGTTEDQHNPIWIMDNVSYVSAGASHTMAITTDGALWGWGGNRNGQIGSGTTESYLYPIWIMDNIVAVSSGYAHTLAITQDGVLWGWGANGAGQLGDGTTVDRHVPVKIMENVALPAG